MPSFAVNLDVIPVGADLVKIWGVEAELFLMIDDAGLLRGTVSNFLFSKSCYVCAIGVGDRGAPAPTFENLQKLATIGQKSASSRATFL